MSVKYEGRPCRHCGGTVRYTNGNSCVVCMGARRLQRDQVGRRSMQALVAVVAASTAEEMAEAMSLAREVVKACPAYLWSRNVRVEK